MKQVFQFFSPDELSTWALGSYEAACRGCLPYVCEGERVIPDARDFAERVVGEVHARIALAFGRRCGESLGDCMGWNAERLLDAAGVDFVRSELNGLPVEGKESNNRESGGNYAI